MSRHPRHIQLMRSESAGDRAISDDYDGDDSDEDASSSTGLQGRQVLLRMGSALTGENHGADGAGNAPRSVVRNRKRRSHESDKVHEAQIQKLKQELGDVLSNSFLYESLPDSVFAEVMGKSSRHMESSSQAPDHGNHSKVQKHRRLNLGSDVVTVIAERIIRQKTNEIQGSAIRNTDKIGEIDSALSKAAPKMDVRTFDALRRHVRDRESGNFFSLLHGMIKSYMAKECSNDGSSNGIRTANDDNTSPDGNSTSEASKPHSKKRLRPGLRSQQLSELVSRAVRESSLTHALVACKALMCQMRANGSRAEPLHTTASKALRMLAQHFVPSVEQMRKEIKRYWRRHTLEGWQSRCSLTCVWRGQSRRNFILRRGPSASQFYLVRGSNFALQAFGINTFGTGHLYFEVAFPAAYIKTRGLRIGWASTESPLAPNTVSRTGNIYPEVWQMLEFKSTQQTRDRMSQKNELGARRRQWGLDIADGSYIYCEGKKRPLQWRMRKPRSSSSTKRSGTSSATGSQAKSKKDGMAETPEQEGQNKRTRIQKGDNNEYIFGCHYDTNSGRIWYSMQGGKIVCDAVSVPVLRPGAFLVPSITCSGNVRDWNGLVVLGEGSIEDADAKKPPLHRFKPLVGALPFSSSSSSPSSSSVTRLAEEAARRSPLSSAWTCVSEYGVAYRNSPKMSDRWETKRGPEEFESVYPEDMTQDGKWIIVTVDGHGKKYLPIESSDQPDGSWGSGFDFGMRNRDGQESSSEGRGSSTNTPTKPLFIPSSVAYKFRQSDPYQCTPFDPFRPEEGSKNMDSGKSDSGLRKGNNLKVPAKEGVSTALRSCGINFGKNGGTRIVLPASTRMDVCELQVITYELRVRIPAELRKHNRHVLLCRGGEVRNAFHGNHLQGEKRISEFSQPGRNPEKESESYSKVRDYRTPPKISYPRDDPLNSNSTTVSQSRTSVSHFTSNTRKSRGGGYDIGVTSLGAIYVLFHGVHGGEICSVPGVLSEGELCFLKITICAYPSAAVIFAVNGCAIPEDTKNKPKVVDVPSISNSEASESSFIGVRTYSPNTPLFPSQSFNSPPESGGFHSQKLHEFHKKGTSSSPFSSSTSLKNPSSQAIRITSTRSPIVIGGRRSQNNPTEIYKLPSRHNDLDLQEDETLNNKTGETHAQDVGDETKRNEENRINKRLNENAKSEVDESDNAGNLETFSTTSWTGSLFALRIWGSSLPDGYSFLLKGSRCECVGNEASLLACLRFDEGTGSTVYDSKWSKHSPESSQIPQNGQILFGRDGHWESVPFFSDSLLRLSSDFVEETSDETGDTLSGLNEADDTSGALDLAINMYETEFEDQSEDVETHISSSTDSDVETSDDELDAYDLSLNRSTSVGSGHLRAWLASHSHERLSPDVCVAIFLSGLERIATAAIELGINESNPNTRLGVTAKDPRFKRSMGIEPKFFTFALLSSIIWQLLKGDSNTIMPNRRLATLSSLCCLRILRANIIYMIKQNTDGQKETINLENIFGKNMSNKFLQGLRAFLLEIGTSEYTKQKEQTNRGSHSNNRSNTVRVCHLPAVSPFKVSTSQSSAAQLRSRRSRKGTRGRPRQTYQKPFIKYSRNAESSNASNREDGMNEIAMAAVDVLVSGFQIFFPSPARRRELITFLIHDAHSEKYEIAGEVREHQDGQHQAAAKCVAGCILGKRRKYFRSRMLAMVSKEESVLVSLLPLSMKIVNWSNSPHRDSKTTWSHNNVSCNTVTCEELSSSKGYVKSTFSPPYTIDECRNGDESTVDRKVILAFLQETASTDWLRSHVLDNAANYSVQVDQETSKENGKLLIDPIFEAYIAFLSSEHESSSRADLLKIFGAGLRYLKSYHRLDSARRQRNVRKAWRYKSQLSADNSKDQQAAIKKTLLKHFKRAKKGLIDREEIYTRQIIHRLVVLTAGQYMLKPNGPAAGTKDSSRLAQVQEEPSLSVSPITSTISTYLAESQSSTIQNTSGQDDTVVDVNNVPSSLLNDVDYAPSLLVDTLEASVQLSYVKEDGMSGRANHRTKSTPGWASLISNMPCRPKSGVYTWVWRIDKCDFGRAALGFSQKPCCLNVGPVGGNMNSIGDMSILKDGSASTSIGLRFTGDLYKNGQLIKRKYSSRLLPGTLIYVTYDSNSDTVSYGNYTERHDLGVAFRDIAEGRPNGLYLTLSLMDPDDKCTLVQHFMGAVANIGSGGAIFSKSYEISTGLHRPIDPPDSFLIDMTKLLLQHCVQFLQESNLPQTSSQQSIGSTSARLTSSVVHHLNPLLSYYLPHCITSIILWRNIPATLAKSLLRPTASCHKAIELLLDRWVTQLRNKRSAKKILTYESSTKNLAETDKNSNSTSSHGLGIDPSYNMFHGLKLLLFSLKGSLAARLIEADLGKHGNNDNSGISAGETPSTDSFISPNMTSTQVINALRNVDEKAIQPWIELRPFSLGLRSADNAIEDMDFIHGIAGRTNLGTSSSFEKGARFASWMWKSRSKSVIRRRTHEVMIKKYQLEDGVRQILAALIYHAGLSSIAKTELDAVWPLSSSSPEAPAAIEKDPSSPLLECYKCLASILNEISAKWKGSMSYVSKIIDARCSFLLWVNATIVNYKQKFHKTPDQTNDISEILRSSLAPVIHFIPFRCKNEKVSSLKPSTKVAMILEEDGILHRQIYTKMLESLTVANMRVEGYLALVDSLKYTTNLSSSKPTDVDFIGNEATNKQIDIAQMRLLIPFDGSLQPLHVGACVQQMLTALQDPRVMHDPVALDCGTRKKLQNARSQLFQTLIMQLDAHDRPTENLMQSMFIYALALLSHHNDKTTIIESDIIRMLCKIMSRARENIARRSRASDNVSNLIQTMNTSHASMKTICILARQLIFCPSESAETFQAASLVDNSTNKSVFEVLFEELNNAASRLGAEQSHYSDSSESKNEIVSASMLYAEMKLGAWNGDEYLLNEISALLCAFSLSKTEESGYFNSPRWLSLLLRLIPVCPGHIQRRLMRVISHILLNMDPKASDAPMFPAWSSPCDIISMQKNESSMKTPCELVDYLLELSGRPMMAWGQSTLEVSVAPHQFSAFLLSSEAIAILRSMLCDNEDKIMVDEYAKSNERNLVQWKDILHDRLVSCINEFAALRLDDQSKSSQDDKSSIKKIGRYLAAVSVLGGFWEPLRPGSSIFVTCPANSDRFHPGITGRAIIESFEFEPSSRSSGKINIVQYRHKHDKKMHRKAVHAKQVHPIPQIEAPVTGSIHSKSLVKSMLKSLGNCLSQVHAMQNTLSTADESKDNMVRGIHEANLDSNSDSTVSTKINEGYKESKTELFAREEKSANACNEENENSGYKNWKNTSRNPKRKEREMMSMLRLASTLSCCEHLFVNSKNIKETFLMKHSTSSESESINPSNNLLSVTSTTSAERLVHQLLSFASRPTPKSSTSTFGISSISVLEDVLQECIERWYACQRELAVSAISANNPEILDVDKRSLAFRRGNGYSQGPYGGDQDSPAALTAFLKLQIDDTQSNTNPSVIKHISQALDQSMEPIHPSIRVKPAAKIAIQLILLKILWELVRKVYDVRREPLHVDHHDCSVALHEYCETLSMTNLLKHAEHEAQQRVSMLEIVHDNQNQRGGDATYIHEDAWEGVIDQVHTFLVGFLNSDNSTPSQSPKISESESKLEVTENIDESNKHWLSVHISCARYIVGVLSYFAAEIQSIAGEFVIESDEIDFVDMDILSNSIDEDEELRYLDVGECIGIAKIYKLENLRTGSTIPAPKNHTMTLPMTIPQISAISGEPRLDTEEKIQDSDKEDASESSGSESTDTEQSDWQDDSQLNVSMMSELEEMTESDNQIGGEELLVPSDNTKVTNLFRENEGVQFYEAMQDNKNSSALSNMVEMGFPEHWCLQALDENDGDQTASVSWIINNGEQLAQQDEADRSNSSVASASAEDELEDHSDDGYGITFDEYMENFSEINTNESSNVNISRGAIFNVPQMSYEASEQTDHPSNHDMQSPTDEMTKKDSHDSNSRHEMPEDSMEEELGDQSTSHSRFSQNTAVKDRLSSYREVMEIREKLECERLWLPGDNRLSLRSALCKLKLNDIVRTLRKVCDALVILYCRRICLMILLQCHEISKTATVDPENRILSLFMGSNFNFATANSTEKRMPLASMYSFLRIVISRDLVPTWWPPVAPKSEQAWQRRNQLAVGDRITASSMSTLRNLLFSVFLAGCQQKKALKSTSLPLERMRAYMLDKLRQDIQMASLRKYAKLKHETKGYAAMHDEEILSNPNIEFNEWETDFLISSNSLRELFEVYQVWIDALKSPSVSLKQHAFSVLAKILHRAIEIEKCTNNDGSIDDDMTKASKTSSRLERFIDCSPTSRIYAMTSRRFYKELEQNPLYSTYLKRMLEFAGILSQIESRNENYLTIYEKEPKDQEKSTSPKVTQSCLQFSHPASHVALASTNSSKPNDISPPWTAEFWVKRPALEKVGIKSAKSIMDEDVCTKKKQSSQIKEQANRLETLASSSGYRLHLCCSGKLCPPHDAVNINREEGFILQAEHNRAREMDKSDSTSNFSGDVIMNTDTMRKVVPAVRRSSSFKKHTNSLAAGQRGSDNGHDKSLARGGPFVGFEVVQQSSLLGNVSSYDGVYSFPYEVPRNVWTHLAFVADVCSGKTTIKLIVNGKVVGEHLLSDGLDVKLPCEYIGSTCNSFSGLASEIRFWSMSRSKSEICRDMHRILPVQSPRIGHFVNHLRGYWVLQSGVGTHVDDLSGNHSECFAHGTSWERILNTDFKPPTGNLSNFSDSKFSILQLKDMTKKHYSDGGLEENLQNVILINSPEYELVGSWKSIASTNMNSPWAWEKSQSFVIIFCIRGAPDLQNNTIPIHGKVMWPDISTIASIEGTIQLSYSELTPFRELLDTFSAAISKNATTLQLQAAKDAQNDDAIRSYTRLLFPEDLPPSSEKLSFSITKLLWGSEKCMGWVVNSKWSCKLESGGIISSGKWEVPISVQDPSELEPYEMRFSTTCQKFPAGSVVFSEDSKYVENHISSCRNNSKTEYDFKDKAWCIMTVDTGHKKQHNCMNIDDDNSEFGFDAELQASSNTENMNHSHFVPAADNNYRPSTPEIIIGNTFKKYYQEKQGPPRAHESIDGRCQFIDRLWEIKIWKITPGATIGFCLRDGTDEYLRCEDNEGSSGFEYPCRPDEEDIFSTFDLKDTQQLPENAIKKSSSSPESVEDDIIFSLVVTDGSETLELILQIFYAKFNPSKLEDIPSIIDHYCREGRTLIDMIASQVEVYKESPLAFFYRRVHKKLGNCNARPNSSIRSAFPVIGDSAELCFWKNFPGDPPDNWLNQDAVILDPKSIHTSRGDLDNSTLRQSTLSILLGQENNDCNDSAEESQTLNSDDEDSNEDEYNLKQALEMSKISTSATCDETKVEVSAIESKNSGDLEQSGESAKLMKKKESRVAEPAENLNEKATGLNVDASTSLPDYAKGLGFQRFSIGWDICSDVVRIRAEGMRAPKDKDAVNAPIRENKSKVYHGSDGKSLFAIDRSTGTVIEKVQTNTKSNNGFKPGDTLGIFLDGKTRTLHLFRNGQPYHPTKPVFADSRLLDRWDFSKLDLVPAVSFPANKKVGVQVNKYYSNLFQRDTEGISLPMQNDSSLGVCGFEILGFRHGFYFPKMTFCNWKDQRGIVDTVRKGSSSRRLSMIQGVKSYEGGWRYGQFHGRDCIQTRWPIPNAGLYQLDCSRGCFVEGLRQGVHELWTTSQLPSILVNGKEKRAGPPRLSEDDCGDVNYPNYGSLECYGKDGFGNNMYPQVKIALKFAWAEEIVECRFDKQTGRNLSTNPRCWVGCTNRKYTTERKTLGQILYERKKRPGNTNRRTSSGLVFDSHGKPACSQGHSLELCKRRRGNSWNCDAKMEAQGCLRRGKLKGQQRWRCTGGCDFDYCGTCYKHKCTLKDKYMEDLAKEKLAEEKETNKLVKLLHQIEAEDSELLRVDVASEINDHATALKGEIMLQPSTRKETLRGSFEAQHDQLFVLDKRNVISSRDMYRPNEWTADYEEGGRRWVPPVEISEDLKSAKLPKGAEPCLILGNRGFSSGVHYWEVDITEVGYFGSMTIGVSESRRRRIVESSDRNRKMNVKYSKKPGILERTMDSIYDSNKSKSPWGAGQSMSPASAFASVNPPNCDLGKCCSYGYDSAVPNSGRDGHRGDYGYMSYRCSINPDGHLQTYGWHFAKGHKVGVILDMDRGVVAFVLDGMSRALHKDVTDNLGVAHRFVRSKGHDMSAPGQNFGDADTRGTPGSRHLTLYPSFHFSKPGDSISISNMKHISTVGRKARDRLDDVLHALLLMQRWRVGISSGARQKLPRSFLQESYSTLKNWGIGLRTYKTRAGVSIVVDPRTHMCSSKIHGLVCKGGDRYKMNRGIAVILGAYRGHLWYRLEGEREEEREHAGNVWYWTKSELSTKLVSGEIKIAKDKRRKNTSKSENEKDIEAENSESESDDDDPLVDEGASTLAMYIGDQGFSERECRDLVLMNGKNCDAAVAFVFSGVDAKTAAIEWREAKNAEKKAKRDAKEKEKKAMMKDGLNQNSSGNNDNWRSLLPMDEEKSTDMDEISFEQFKHWMNDFKWRNEGPDHSRLESLSSWELDEAIVKCVNLAADTTSKEPEHLTRADLANALTEFPKLNHAVAQMTEGEDTRGSNDSAEAFVDGHRDESKHIASGTKIGDAVVTVPNIFLARFAVLLNLNKKMSQLLPLIDLSLQRNESICVDQSREYTLFPSSSYYKPEGAYKYLSDWGRQLASLRGLLFRSTKLEHWRNMLRATTVPVTPPDDELDRPHGIPKINLNRIKARKERLKALMEYSKHGDNYDYVEQSSSEISSQEDERYSDLNGFLGSITQHEAASIALGSSLLGQLGKYLSKGNVLSGNQRLRTAFVDVSDAGQERAFYVDFIGEGVDDHGGPYRAVFQQACGEEPEVLGLLKRCSDGESHDLCELNSNSIISGFSKITAVRGKRDNEAILTSEVDMAQFRNFGKLLGMSIRHKIMVPLRFASTVWYPLVGLPISAAKALAQIDKMLPKQLRDLAKMSEFDEDTLGLYESTLQLAQGKDDSSTLLVKPSAITKAMMKSLRADFSASNRQRFVRLVERIRLERSAPQLDAFLQGIGQVIPIDLFPLWSPQELELLVCGPTHIDIDLLRSVTVYDSGLSEDDNHIQYFWDSLEDFTDDQRSQFLKFVSASSRLPASASEFAMKFMIKRPESGGMEHNPDKYLPKALTCFFTLHLPRYTSKEQCKKKLLQAITCTTMDADFNQRDSLDAYDE